MTRWTTRRPTSPSVERLRALGATGKMLDIGTGPAHIPLLICSLIPTPRSWRSTPPNHMLRVAHKKNCRASPVGARVRLHKADAKGLAFPDHSFDAVFSNTILHHIPIRGPSSARPGACSSRAGCC